MSKKPLYIISNNDDSSSLTMLGDEDITTLYETSTTGSLISASDPDSIVNGLTKIMKERKKIDKANQ